MSYFLRRILILSSYLHLRRPKDVFPFRFSNYSPVCTSHLLDPIRATYLTHNIFLDVVTLIA